MSNLKEIKAAFKEILDAMDSNLTRLWEDDLSDKHDCVMLSPCTIFEGDEDEGEEVEFTGVEGSIRKLDLLLNANQYGNLQGCHTPERTERALAFFNDICTLEFTDSSWHNDTCDSISCAKGKDESKHVYIFIPNGNTEEDGEDKINTTVNVYIGEYGGDNEVHEFKDEFDAGKFINERYPAKKS